jgi:DNA uptake protein ComE-like DNA-binding protein
MISDFDSTSPNPGQSIGLADHPNVTWSSGPWWRLLSLQNLHAFPLNRIGLKATSSFFSGPNATRASARVARHWWAEARPAFSQAPGTRRRPVSRKHRRGAIFVITLAITVMLSALVLVYAQEMRTEMASSANRLSAAQADAVEQGAEQWVLSQVEANITPLPTSGGGAAQSNSNAVDPTTIPAEALQVGGGYFWLLHPDPTQDKTYAFGLVDESGKLNLNGATADQLINLPNMTQNLTTSITNWPTTAGPSGTTLTYETVEELLLADPTLTPQVLYGYDLNHDGVIDTGEQTAANGAAITNGTTTDSRGFFNYVTVYSTNAQPGTPGTTRSTPFAKKTIGLINVNTAPVQVLMCIPGMTQANAQTLVNARTQSPTTGTSWVASTLSQSQAQAMAPYISGTSYQYSADIVAVSGDGRSFKRVRIVVDARQQPASIVYRKDLTNLGWPLPPEVQTSLRAGKGVPAEVTGTTNQETNGLGS